MNPLMHTAQGAQFHRRFAFTISLLAALPFLTTARWASAQVPESLMDQERASTGKTEITGAGFEKRAEPPEPGKDTTEAKVAAGGLFAAGNTRSMAVTSSGKLRVRRNVHQFSAAAAGNFARSAADASEGMETTVENLQGKVRYDYFLTDSVALFLASSARRDRFQGLALRLNLDPGIAYYFINEKKHQLWTEVGYDLQYDLRRDEALAAAAAEGKPLDRGDLRHAGRLFLGYENNINQAVAFSTGVEYLQGVPETEYWRLNWDAELSSSIGGNFSVATTVSIKYDNKPLPSIERTDAITAVSLVYQLL